MDTLTGEAAEVEAEDTEVRIEDYGRDVVGPDGD